MPHPEERTATACVTSGCGHPANDHVATPELAASTEIVVWCASCHKHEVHRPRRLRLPWSRGAEPRGRRRYSRPT